MFTSFKLTALALTASLGLLLATPSFSQSANAPAATAPAATTTPAAPAVTAAPAAAVTTAGNATNAAAAEAENPYGLKALWAQGDWVAKITLLILVLMSIASWYVIVTKYLEQSKAANFGKAVSKSGFWQAANLRAATDGLSPQSPYRYIAEKGIESAGKHSGILGNVDYNSWISMSLSRALTSIQNRMQDGLAILATVGSTAPFVGLFGTVWGIYNALVKIGLSGQASIDKVAGPVGESLIMTAIGLAVAVPAVLGYNWLVRRNKGVMEGLNAYGAELHAALMAAKK